MNYNLKLKIVDIEEEYSSDELCKIIIKKNMKSKVKNPFKNIEKNITKTV